MDGDMNGTYIYMSGLVEVERYRFLYFVSILTVYVLIICFNATIVYLIYIHKSLHEPMFMFIAALLVNSVLFSSVIYPKLLLDVLSEKQMISFSSCLCQFQFFYSLGGSEFLLLTSMAYDRYVSICKPLQYPTIMTKTAVSSLLVAAWVLPACQVASVSGLSANRKLCRFTLKGLYCSNTLYKLQCSISKVQFIHDYFILFNIAFLPLLFIFFSYVRILLITFQSSREVKTKAAQTCLPHIVVLINFSCLCAFDIIAIQLEEHIPRTARLIINLQIVLYPPLFNPIIYGLKMKEISKHLHRLFLPQKVM
ncbi:olfactory receptor 6N2-like [Salarias fasciatus]|uniref:olfactory receptor 6N2-like n=1 Tax=Salarias fasciatus TaxID=181472 RepID=UPI0011768262|nr:olfactory receptor 6N2-like [Salarias fasciatus]